jgi:uncharacterized protein (TIGR03545 family)
VFRWRGVFALLFFLGIAALWWLVFGERVIRHTLVEAGSKSLGTQVDVASLKLNVMRTKAELRGIAIADPFDPMRNLVEADALTLEVVPEPLLEKKVVVKQLSVSGVRAGTRRATAARAVAGGGFAPRALQEVERFKKQFQVPLLSLTPIDTIKAIALDPAQLRTVREALAIQTRADSLRRDVVDRVNAIHVRETVDSARALLTRLQGQTPRSLGITGLRSAVTDVRRFSARVDTIKRTVEDLGRFARSAADSVGASVNRLNDARKADYEFARGLLALPKVDAPSIGPALFGKVTIDAFQQGIYWVGLARAYAPPGLVPRETPGPTRLRRAGTTVHFVAPQNYPRFLLQRGDLALSIGGTSAARGEYTLRVLDVTTDPAIVRRPTQFALRRTAGGGGVETLTASGSLNHIGAKPRDVVDVRAQGMSLPSFTLPGLPLRANLGRGTSAWHLDMNGDNLAGQLQIETNSVSWPRDSARARALNTLESLVARVIERVDQLNVSAQIGGSMRSPTLAVRSNLDREIADGIKAVAGEEIAKAEVRVRAQVDALVEEKVAPLRARVTEVRAEVEQRVRDAQAQLDDVKTKLAAQLKTLGGGLIGLP